MPKPKARTKKSRPGRPSKYDGVNLQQVEELARLGLIDEEIATVIGICPKTLENWKKKPEFLQAIKRGKLDADKVVIEKLYDRAKQGDITAIIFWLKNRRKGDWRDRQDHSVEGNMDVTAKVIFQMPRPGQKQ